MQHFRLGVAQRQMCCVTSVTVNLHNTGLLQRLILKFVVIVLLIGCYDLSLDPAHFIVSYLRISIVVGTTVFIMINDNVGHCERINIMRGLRFSITIGYIFKLIMY